MGSWVEVESAIPMAKNITCQSVLVRRDVDEGVALANVRGSDFGVTVGEL